MNKRKNIKKRVFFALLAATSIIVTSMFIFSKTQREETIELGKMTINVPYTFNSSSETIVASWDISASDSDHVSAVLYEDGRLVISGNGKMESWNNFTSSPDWSGRRNNILTVEIQNGVKNIGSNAFYECHNISTIQIPDSVEDIELYSFHECNKLTDITIPEGVTSIGEECFYGCTSLTNIVVPSTVETINKKAFEGCNNLSNVEIKNGVKNIGTQCFKGCSNLTNIQIPSSVTSIESQEDSEFSSISVDEDNTTYSSSNGVLFDKNKTTLICYPGGKNDKTYNIPSGVTTIKKYSFSGCKNTEHLKIPSSARIIEEYSFNGSNFTSIEIENGLTTIGTSAFKACDNLINIEIPNSVTSIGSNAFSYCDNLTNVTLSKGLTSLETEVFRECKSLQSIIIPGNIKTIFSSAFESCTSLETVDIQEGVTTLSAINHFRDCNNLKSISLPSTLTNLGSYTFVNCYNLTDIIIPSHIDTIGDETFENCINIKNIVIPSNVKTVKFRAFSNCSKLETLEIQEGVENIEAQVFDNCKKLSNVKIPSTVKALPYGVFFDCTNLGNVYILNNNIEMHPLDYRTNYTIYCKSNSTAEAFANEHSIPYVVDDDGPTINFNPNGNSQLAKEQTTTVNVTDDKSGIENNRLKYVWSQNTQTPALEDFQDSFLNNTSLSKNDDNGDWYLWILAYDIMENYTISSSNKFVLDNTKPTVTVSTDKEHYYEGETATITATFNEDIKDGTPKISINGPSTLTSTEMTKSSSKIYTYNYVVPKGNGIQTITISEASDLAGNVIDDNNTKKINIESIILSSIAVTTVPEKTAYMEGENFDTTGMKVTANYNNSTNKEITNYTVTDGNDLTPDRTSVTISYTENDVTKTTTQPITVTSKLKMSFNGYNEVDKDGNKYIDNIAPDTTMENMIDNVETNGTITVYKDNTEITDKKIKISTGMKVKISLNNENYQFTMVVKGDTNGNGECDLKDLLQINKHRLNKTLLSAEYLLAGDVNKDNEVNLKDLLQINKFRLGKIKTL